MRPFSRFVIVFALATTLLAAPAFAKSPTAPAQYIFFPPAPDEPHIQFLASFSSEAEMAELGGKRSFFKFIVGSDIIDKPIDKPYGVATTPGKIYICDTVLRVVEIADIAKSKLSYFSPGGEAALGLPVNIAVDADGTRYITDTKRNQVLVFKEDDYVGVIGQMNEIKPIGIALSKDRIYVTDSKNHCVRVYEKASRKELFTFPKAGETNKAAQLFSPTNVAIDPKGRVVVSDTGGFCVNVFDREGNYLRTIGSQGLAPGKFALPKGVAVDRESRTYVVDANTQVVQLFDAEGRILMYFGDPVRKGGGGTGLPSGITVDYDNVKYFQRFAAPDFTVEFLIFLINQTGGEKVSVFGFGHKK